MIDLSDCIELGTLVKPHGTQGQLALRLNNLSPDDILEMESVFIIINGLPVPFFVTNYFEKNNENLVLTLNFVTSEDKARELVDASVFAKLNTVNTQSEAVLKNDTLLGYEVIDIHKGRLGILEDIFDYQFNPLFQIIDMKKEILLPIHQEFIVKVDEKKKQIFVNTPKGLTDLF